jgi:hypothetical protein
MSKPRKYPEELRSRAVRLVGEAREEEEGLSLHAAVVRIGRLVGCIRTRCGCGVARLMRSIASLSRTLCEIVCFC